MKEVREKSMTKEIVIAEFVTTMGKILEIVPKGMYHVGDTIHTDKGEYRILGISGNTKMHETDSYFFTVGT